MYRYTCTLSRCFVLVVAAIACKDIPNPFASTTSTTRAWQFHYSINFVASGALARQNPKRGAVGGVRLSTIPDDDGIEVRGEVSTDVDIGVHAHTHRLSHDYRATQQPPTYNIFTLPLYLRQLAVTHSKTITTLNALLQEITLQERQLLTAGKATYPAFTELHTVNSGNYRFTGLNRQRQVAFADKQLSTSLTAVRKEIDARTAALRRSVLYRQNALLPVATRDFDSQSLYRQAVVLYRAAYPNIKRDPQSFAPSFRAKGTRKGASADMLKHIVTELSTLKQAKLLLARTLLRLYEPHYLRYEFNLLGHQETLSLAVSADDKHSRLGGRTVVLSYRLQASSPQQGSFQLGQCDLDQHHRPLRLRTNLKPVGKGHIDLVLKTSN